MNSTERQALLLFQEYFLDKGKCLLSPFYVLCLCKDCGSTYTTEQHVCPCDAAQPWDNSALAHQAVKSIPELLSQTDHWLDL